MKRLQMSRTIIMQGAISLFLLCPFNGYAQESTVWNLERCIDYALENNIQLKQTRLGVQMAAANLVQSRANLLPSINANATQGYNFGRSVDPFTNDFVNQKIQSNSFSLTGNVTLFGGMTNYNNVKQKEEDWQAAKYDSDKAANDITLAVAGSYLEILFNRELEQVARNQMILTESQLDRMEKLVNAGSLTRGDLLEIEAQYSIDELQHVEAKNRLALSILSLQQLLDLDPSNDFDIVVPEIELPEESKLKSTPGLIYDVAIDIMPEVKAAGHRLVSSEKGLAMAKGSLSPTLSVGGSYSTGYSSGRSRIVSTEFMDLYTLGMNSGGEVVLFPHYSYNYETTPFADQVKDNINQSIGFNLSIPIFNGWQGRTSIKLATIALKNAEYEVQLEKQRIKEIIERSYMDAAAAIKTYRSSQRTVAALEESFTYSQKRFDVGLINAVEFNDAKNKLARASSELLRAKYDYVYKLKILEFYQGNSLSF